MRSATILLIAAMAGCANVTTREATVRNAVDRGRERIDASVGLAPTSREVLSRHHLLHADPEFAALQLEASLRSRPGAETDGPLALAELWYRVALRQRPQESTAALCAYRNTAAAAAIAAGTPGASCPGKAVAIHNEAVARILRLSKADASRCDAPWNATLASAGVATTAIHPFVDPGRFSEVEVARDVRVSGMRSEYACPGIGVPVVALRPNDRLHPREPSEAFFPPKMRVAATVVAVPQGGLIDATWRTNPVSLVFHDPFRARTVAVGARTFPMATDTTTPLAVQASQQILSAETLLGLFASDFQRGLDPGLYLLRPYEPGKIPVVFVHGLSSNPGAFVQTINELGNDPIISSRYQFLLFAYPTGRPIPMSALRLRRALYEAESKFGGDPAFNQMVVVGHSMGGNLARFMVTDTGMTLWNAVFRVPYDRFQASPRTKSMLTDALIFRPVPFVRQTVFIAASHQGSPVADEPFGRIVARFITPPAEQGEMIAEIEAANGPDVVRDDVLRNRSISSIGNLSPGNPILRSMATLPLAPGVRHHTIQFQFLGRLPTDLVVQNSSSRIAGVVSERNLPGTHVSEQSPGAVAELRRILLE